MRPSVDARTRWMPEGRLRFRPSGCKALKSRTCCRPPLGTIPPRMHARVRLIDGAMDRAPQSRDLRDQVAAADPEERWASWQRARQGACCRRMMCAARKAGRRRPTRPLTASSRRSKAGSRPTRRPKTRRRQRQRRRATTKRSRSSATGGRDMAMTEDRTEALDGMLDKL
jgi:hypothetical protein